MWLRAYNICFVLFYMVSSINGHGRLVDPPSRVTAWRYGFNTPRDYTDNEYNCGGFSRQWNVNGGKCGVCGDAWNLNPRPSEAGGKYATGTIVKSYSVGQIIEVGVDLTANHLGYMEFKLCPVKKSFRAVTQDCLDQTPLPLSDGSGYKFYMGRNSGVHKVKLQLPRNIACKHCVLQWRYRGGNNWGICADGRGAVGCGPQEEFRACADVTITNNGNPPSGGSITIPNRPGKEPTNAPTDLVNDVTTRVASPIDAGCSSSGFIRDPRDCSRFYRCIPTVGGGWKHVPFKCPPGLAFNVAISVCDWPYNVAGC